MAEATLQQRRGVAEEVRQEVRAILAEMAEALQKAMAPPAVVQYEASGEADLEAARIAVRAAIERETAGYTVTLPGGATYKIAPAVRELLGKIARLSWLLGLCDAERSFIDSAASAATSGDPTGLHETLMVFADWLEDQGRQAHGAEVRRLVPQRGNILLLTVPRGADTEREEVLNGIGRRLDQFLRDVGRECYIVKVQEGATIPILDEAAMRRLGWERCDDVRRLKETMQQTSENNRALQRENARLNAIDRTHCMCRWDGIRLVEPCELHLKWRAEAVRQERDACASECDRVVNDYVASDPAIIGARRCKTAIRNRPPV